MKIIKDLYEKRNSVPLDKAICKDTHGDYETMLLTLIGHVEEWGIGRWVFGGWFDACGYGNKIVLVNLILVVHVSGVGFCFELNNVVWLRTSVCVCVRVFSSESYNGKFSMILLFMKSIIIITLLKKMNDTWNSDFVHFFYLGGRKKMWIRNLKIYMMNKSEDLYVHHLWTLSV